ncbi:MAG: prepilin-type N-terminal cleavage/methylation domain-containing protein [Lachnospiraceae bacterium]|nr:prepilin-type N-terminal cleavage/methylation domain-containing protein [Lachnospiraceae bacterium]
MKSSKNSGLSLVELVAAIAILAVASVAILGFLNASTRHYGKENKDVNLQYEAQVASNQIMELLIDAKSEVDFSDSGSIRKLTVYDAADTYYVLTWKQNDHKIYYSEFVAGAQTANEELLAEYVEDFNVDLSKLTVNKTVRFEIQYKNDDKVYTVAQNVTCRNPVKLHGTTP